MEYQYRTPLEDLEILCKYRDMLRFTDLYVDHQRDALFYLCEKQHVTGGDIDHMLDGDLDDCLGYYYLSDEKFIELIQLFNLLQERGALNFLRERIFATGEESIAINEYIMCKNCGSEPLLENFECLTKYQRCVLYVFLGLKEEIRAIKEPSLKIVKLLERFGLEELLDCDWVVETYEGRAPGKLIDKYYLPPDGTGYLKGLKAIERLDEFCH